MRALTESEARVIAVLLSALPDRERERLRRIDIPRSTYHAARRRAYEEGWLRDRYVPDPSRFGLPFAMFVVARPFVDRVADLVAEWQREPGNVVLWAGSQVALGVFFLPTVEEAKRISNQFDALKLGSWHESITVRLDQPSIPVYFDFEGLWSHLAAMAGTLAYPHGLGGPGPDGENDERPAPGTLNPSMSWAVAELLHRPFVGQEQGRPGHLMGPLGLPFSQQKLLTRGWVLHRVFLEPSRLPAFKGRSADQVNLILGRPKSGTRPEELFATLTRDCRVFPFLYVASPERFLIAALGSSVPAAPTESGPEPRRPVLATLQANLEGIEIVQELAPNLVNHVDHRYDRLFARKG
ncbi:MAG: hypothetical protein WB778_07405 [Thermoplasmata archaeon]